MFPGYAHCAHGRVRSLTDDESRATVERIICFRDTQTVPVAARYKRSIPPQIIVTRIIRDISRCPHGPVVNKFYCPAPYFYLPRDVGTCLSLSPVRCRIFQSLRSPQSVITCFNCTLLGVRSLANASRARQFNPLNPPGWGGSNLFKVRVSIRTCVPNLGAVRRERFLTIYNPLIPPGVGWVNIFFKVRVSIRTCVPNLGAIRRERFLTIYNPLNPPGVGWVNFV